jgi:hypothetical protein
MSNISRLLIVPLPTPFSGIFETELSLWGLGTEEEEGYRTGPPGYIGWRNSFLGIDSEAPYTFKNTGSEIYCKLLQRIHLLELFVAIS